MRQAPIVRIDLASETPAVRQIADSIRVHLVEGRLAPGDALLSVRRLAMELGVHFNTVAEAYRVLAAEGWLELKHGRSAVVVEREGPAKTNRDRVDSYFARLRGLVAQLRAEGVPTTKIAAELREIAEAIAKC